MALVRGGSYGHRIVYKRPDEYVISWRVDIKYGSSRLRHTRTHVRDTDEKGARRFSKKWNVPMPAPVSTPPTVRSERKQQ